MQVTGGQIRAKLQALALLIRMAEADFENSLKGFPGEDKDPVRTMTELVDLEDQMVRLQTAQARYNLGVMVQVGDKTMTLTEAVKAQGPAGRVAALWRNALPKQDKWGRKELETRGRDDEREEYILPRATIVKFATNAANYAARLNAAINAGNTTVLDIDGLMAGDLDL